MRTICTKTSLAHQCFLTEVPITQDKRSHQRPQVDHQTKPAGNDLHPHGCTVLTHGRDAGIIRSAEIKKKFLIFTMVQCTEAHFSKGFTLNGTSTHLLLINLP